MSDALIGLYGIIIGISITVLLRWMDRKERFRDSTFEKRLSAHQEAYYLNQDLYEALNSNDKNNIRDKADKMKEWWKLNSLYLDDSSTKSMLALFSSALNYTLYPSRPDELQPTWELLDKNLNNIVKGIGAKHLPRINSENTPGKDTPNDDSQGSLRNSFWHWIKENWNISPLLIIFGNYTLETSNI